MSCIIRCNVGGWSEILKNLTDSFSLGLTITLFFFSLTPLNAQSEVQKSTDLSFQNEKLSLVLEKLSVSRDLNFSYDAKDPVYNKIINYSSENISTDKLLDGLLLNTGLTYKKIGNQIVLFHSSVQPAEMKNTELNNPESENSIVISSSNQPSIATVVEFRLDTIYQTDTIFRIDTIRVVDTVFIEPAKEEKEVLEKPKKIPVDFFQPGIERDKGWAMDIFIAPLLADFSMVDGDKPFTLRNFSLGMDATKLLDKWNILMGLRLTQFNQKIDQQYTEQTGGFYNIDTVDSYYTISGVDTSWYYVTDSSWVPLEINEYDYDQTSNLGYLEVNVSASFDLYRNTNWRVYLKAGGQISFLIYNNGIAIADKNTGEGINFNDLHFNTINYSVVIGSGLKYKMTDKLDFGTEVYYLHYFNSLVTDFPINTKINAIGLKFGLIYYL